MNHVKTTTKKSCCPNCGEGFVINVQCTVGCEEGDITRKSAIGYLMELTCNKCGTNFPYFRNTGTNVEMNEAINSCSHLIKEKKIGKAGVGMAQQMLSGLNQES